MRRGMRPFWARRTRGGVLLALAVAALASAFILGGAQAAAIQTDMWVYQTGDTVTVTGEGFAANEMVAFTATDPLGSIIDTGQALADNTGNVQYRFILMATVPGIYTEQANGLSSGLTATTTFDPNPPTGLHYFDSRSEAGSLTLSWTAPMGGTTCYYIFRGATAPTFSGSSNTNCSPSPLPSGVVAVTTSTSWTDPSPTSTQPWYGVTSVKSSGTGSGESTMSNTTNVLGLNNSLTAPVDFGVVALGSTSPAQTFTVTNNSSGPIWFQSVTKAGTNPTAFTVSGTPAANTQVAAGGTITFSATFSPTTSGAYSAELDVNASDTSGGTTLNTRALGVKGTGNSPPTCSNLSPTTNEAPVAVTLSCSDPNAGDTLTYSIVTPPAHGTLSGTAPNLTYTPHQYYSGSDSFTYTATDNHGATSNTATASITVNFVDHAPSCSPVSATTNEAAVTVPLACSDPDPGDTITYSYGQPAHGTVTGTGPNVTYTPYQYYFGPDSFTYTATDSHGMTSTSATASITVNFVNHAPTCSAVSASTNEAAIPVTLSCSDPDSGDTITYLYGQPAHGSVTGTAPNVTYTPNQYYFGPDSFTYTATDNHGVTSTSATASITVNFVDHAPTCSAVSASTKESTPGAVTLSCSDPDPGDTITYSYNQPTHGTLSGTGPNLTYTPRAGYNDSSGTDSFTYTAIDNHGLGSNTATGTLTVVPVNDPPTAGNGSATMNEDSSGTVNLTQFATDPETASTSLVYTIVSGPGHGSLSGGAGGVFTYTPAQHYNGSDSFTYTVTDNGDPAGCSPASSTCDPTVLTSTAGTISLTVYPVNLAPTATDGSSSTNEDTSSTVNLTTLVSDVETAPSSMAYTIVAGPTHGTLTAAATNGSFVYAPAANYNGSDSFTYKVTDTGNPAGCTGSPPACDGPKTSTTQTVSLTVIPVNDQPTASNASVDGIEDTPASIDLTPYVSDVETAKSALTYTIVTAPAHGTVVATATPGVFLYTPSTHYNGGDSFTYNVTDNGDPAGCTVASSTCDPTQLTSATRTVTLNVAPVNAAPVASTGSALTNEDASTTVDLKPLVTDEETPSANMTYTIVSGPAHGTLTAGGTNGSFVYAPAANYNGPDSFSYQATDTGDPAGCTGPAPACAAPKTSTTQTVSLTVIPVNDPPVATNGTATTNEDTPGTVDLTQFASDLETPSGSLTYTIVSAPAHGALSGGSGGIFTYTPATHYNGTDSFTYNVTDNGDPAGCTGASAACDPTQLTSATKTVTLTVAPVNAQPTASGTTVEATANTSVSVDLKPLVSYEETSPANMTYAVVSGPSHGTFTASGTAGVYTYAPAANYSGPDSLTFQVTDRGDPDNCGTPATLCAAPATSTAATITFNVSVPAVPPVTSGLALQYDADSIKQADGSLVTSWSDGSGNGRDLSAALGAAPTLHKAALNGHAAVEFDGLNSLMKTYNSTFTIAQPDTFFVVYRSADPASTTTRGFVFDSMDSSQRQVFGREDGDAMRMYANIDLDATGVTFPFANYELWSGVFNGTGSTMYENGGQILSGNTGAGSLAGFTLGGLNAGGTLGYDRGHSYIAEVLVYSRALSTTELQSVTDWANQRFQVIGTPTAPTNTQKPSLTGSTINGAMLTASTGAWTGTLPRTYSYEIRRCDNTGANCTAVGTSSTYTLTDADVGSTMRVAVTATNSVGSATAVSDPTAVVTQPVLLGSDVPPVTQNLRLWFDANDESYADGAPVTTWRDLSGYGRDLTNAYSDNSDAPTFRASAVNGHAAVEFDGVRSLLKTYNKSFSLAQPDTFFVVYKQLDSGATSEGDLFDSTNSGSRQLLGRQPSGQMEMYANNSLMASAQFPFPAYQVWSGTFNGPSSTLSQNSKLVASGDAGAAPLSGLTVGGLNSGGTFGYNLGHTLVAEILWYTGPLSASDQQSITNFLMQKYGLAAPTATPTPPPPPVVEGTAATFTLANAQTYTSQPLHYAFSCDGSSLSTATYATAGTSSSTTCTYTDGLTTHIIRARVIDVNDLYTEYTQPITITGVAPTATFTVPASVNEGSAIHISLDNPQSAATNAAPFSYAFDCGSGAYGAFGSASSADCPTTDNGTVNVRGQIKDSYGNVTEYTSAVTVANVPPVVTPGSAAGASEASPVLVALGSFTDPGANDGPWNVTVDWGDGSAQATFQAATQGSLGSLTHTWANSGNATVTVTVTDKDNGVGSATFTVGVANVPPSVTAAGSQAATEGASTSFALGTFSDPGVNDGPWAVDVNWGDGSAHAGATASATGSLTNQSHTYATPGTYTVTVTVTDKPGGSGSATFTVTVANVAPTVTAAAGQSANEGTPTSFSLGSFSDPGADGPWAVDVNWGDGTAHASSSASAAGSLGSLSHSYATPGSYTVTVTVTDKPGLPGSATFTVTVANVAPTVTPAGSQSATEGAATTFFIGSFADPGADNPWALDVNWGDGSTHTSSTVTGTGMLPTQGHTYMTPGTYTVTVSVTDKPGLTGSATFTVTVANVAPTVTAASSQSANEGASTTFSLGSFTDPGADGPWAVDVNWGDSSAHTSVSVSATGALAAQTHTYATPGTYTVTVSVTDKPGLAGSASFAVNVANIAPTVTAAANQSANEGASTSFSLGSFTDPGADNPWTVDVNWGDSSTHTTFNTGSTGTLTAQNHSYATPGTYTATVKVTDNLGLFDSKTFTVTVADVAPTVTAAAGQSANEGTSTSFGLGSFTDPGVNDGPWPVDVNWGDGSTHTTFNATAPGTLAAQSHSYANTGTYTVTVKVSDKFNVSDTKTFAVTVNNVAPTVTPPATQSANEGASSSFGLGSFTDPGANDGPWPVDVNWGDGSAHTTFNATSTGTLAAQSHLYGASGSYTVTVKVSDKFNASDTKTFTVTVANVPPTVAITGAPTTSPEGTPIALGSTVSDPGAGLGDTFTYAWSVTKNGSAFASGSGTTLMFTPNDNGAYSATLTVTDKDGGTGTASQSITVTNVAPTASLANNGPINEGSSATITFSGQFDPSSADTSAGFHYAYVCDGALTVPTYAGASTSATTSCHYDDGPSDHTVTAAIIDQNNAFTTYTTIVHVNDVLPTAAFSAPSSVNEASSFTLSLSMPYDPSTADTATLTYAFDCGSGYGPATSLTTVSCAGSAAGTKTVRAKISDKDGFTEYTSTLTVANVAPTPSITDAPASGVEGTTILVHGTSSDPGAAFGETYAYAWSVTKNGSQFGVTGTGSAYSFTPDDNGTYVVTLSVGDGNGTGTTSATINVAGAPPVPTISSPPSSGLEGSPITVSGSSSDGVDTASDAIAQAWTVKLGSTTVASGSGGSVTFTPGLTGTYIVTLTATDKDGLTGTTNVSIPVTNVAPAPTIDGAPTSSPEGTAISLGSTPHDPGAGLGDTFTYAWSVTKNGSAFASGTAASFSFTPDDNGSYVVSLQVTDADGATGTAAQKTITVTNVAPTASLANNGPINEGSNATITFSGQSDPSPVDTTAGFHYAYACDGTLAVPSYASASTLATASCHYDDGPSTHTVTGAIIDKDNGYTTYTTTVQVNNVAPTPAISGAPASSPEGTAIPLTAGATDPSNADTSAGFAYSWSVTKNGGAFGSGTGASYSFTPDDNGTYVVTLTATDKDGGTGTTSSTISVTNVAPTPAISGAPASSPEGTAIPLTAGATDPSSVDTAAGFTYAWSVTKNGSSFGTSGTGASYSFTPDDNASYVVTLTATDKDGGVGTMTKTITVTNVAPTGTFPATATVAVGSPLTLAFTNVTDPSTVDTTAGFHYAYDCTGGTITATYATAGTSASTSCTFSTIGTAAVKARVYDKDNGYTEYTTTVTVTNPPPTTSFSGSNKTSINEGTAAGTQYTYSGSIVNGDATTTVAGDCGSGNAIVSGSLAYTTDGSGNRNGFSFKCVFTYTTPTTYTLHATATRGGVTGPTGTQTVTIANVNPTVTITSPANNTPYTKGSTAYLNSSFTDPGGSADGSYTCTIDWGDGTAKTVLTISAPGACNSNHVYLATSSKITVTVTDKYGGTGTASVNIMVF